MPNRIRELRRRLGLSQEELGARVNTSKQMISKLEKGPAKGGAKLTQAWMERLADALECEPADLLPASRKAGSALPQKEGKQQNINLVSTQLPSASVLPPLKRDLPIFGRIQGVGRGVLMISVETEPLGYTARPPQLEGVDRAFAFYVPDDSMSPKFEAGGEAWVNPILPIVPGKAVLVIQHSDEATLAILVRRSETFVTLRMLNPERTFDIAASDIREIRRVIGGIDPL